MIQEYINHLTVSISAKVEWAFTANPLEDVDVNDPTVPAVYVYPGDYSSQLSQFDNVVRQPVREQVVCLIVCKVEEYEQVRDEVRRYSLGWTFEHYDAFELLSGEIVDLAGGLIFIREIYTTQRIITEHES